MNRRLPYFLPHLLLCLALCLALAAPVRAQGEPLAPQPPQSTPLELWAGLNAGMSREDVRARKPNTKVILSASCEGRFKPVFQDDKLRAVRIVQYLDYNDCGRQLHAALTQKYGLSSGSGSVGYFGLTGFGNTHDFYWHGDGRAIRLRLLESGRFAELSFSPLFPEL